MNRERIRDYNADPYGVGEIVTIRSWDDMKSEFGENEFGGYLMTPGATFQPEMKVYCGKSFMIEYKSEFNGCYRLKDSEERKIGYFFSPCMFEPQPEVFNFDFFIEMLGRFAEDV